MQSNQSPSHGRHEGTEGQRRAPERPGGRGMRVPTAPATEPALLTVTEAATRLSLSRATTYQLVRCGDLPSVRVGRTVRVPVRALEAWIAARTRGGEPAPGASAS